jgi:hypothetical protein
MNVSAEINENAVPERTSEILARLATENSVGSVTVGTILDALRERGFGILIFLFALPNAILPIAWVLGPPVLIFAIQLMLGLREPWLPQKMRNASIKNETFIKLIEYAIKYLRILESWLKPRQSWLTCRVMERVIGFYIVFVTIILLVPVPFGNALPSFGIGVMAAGLLERDGVALIVGALIGALGSAWVLLLVTGAWAAIKATFGL